METEHPETYGQMIAAVYDIWYSSVADGCIDFLSGLANGGKVLELGIGTGRLAIPLKRRGIDISGIDASEAMVERLRKKDDAESILAVIGDFSEVPVEGQFELIFVAFNTFFALTTQERQLKCLENVAKHLSMQGHFVIEAFVPDIGRFSGGQSARVTSILDHEVRMDVSQHDPVKQQVTSQHLVLTEKGIMMYPVSIRYVWPSELDMMALVAGLRLQNRWEDWTKMAFAPSSGKHVSVYGRQ
jgi:SAM-dependent methyltransferase